MENRARYSSPFAEPAASPGACLRVVPPPYVTVSISAATTWAAIRVGTLRVAALQQDPREALVELEQQALPSNSAAMQRRLRVLELVLQGISECAVAIDLDVAPSTVSQHLKEALLFLGLKPRLSAVPLPVAQLYHAAAANASLVARVAKGDEAEPRSMSVVLPRPELDLSCLAPTELLVCQMMLAGRKHAQIAALRGRSVRTIANQVSSVFYKLHVSGRQLLFGDEPASVACPPAAS